MRSCDRADKVLRALVAEEPLDPDLSRHARDCADCTAVIAQARRFERGLHAAVDELITDAMPPDTLHAARLGMPSTRTSAFPRVVLSGLSAAVVVLFAIVGVAATGAGVVGALTSQLAPAADPDVVQREFTTCYIREAVVSSPGGNGQAPMVIVERCLADASQALDVVGSGIVVRLNREATAVSVCLQTRGWEVEPVLEPRGRFLIPPVSSPGGEQQRYVHDVEACAEEER